MTMSDLQLSIVVPCYNEQAVLAEFHKRMMSACADAGVERYELIYVNDGSDDETANLLYRIRQTDARVGIVYLSRNHGHQLALSAGLAYAKGDLVLVIDADLQDPPELLGDMIAEINRGADVVYGERLKRFGETKFKILSASVFYKVLWAVSGTRIPHDAGDFRLMTRRVVDVLVAMPEAHRFLRGLISWIGFKQVPVRYDRSARHAGSSKYPFLKMMAFSLDAITSFAVAPLRVVFLISLLAMLLAVAMLGWTLYSYLFLDAVAGWSSVMTVVLFFSGVQLFGLGLIGEYVGRTFIESKRRPLFVVRAFDPPQRPSAEY
jgi:polyisoprenyl-phosphate glycosyltransferase